MIHIAGIKKGKKEVFCFMFRSDQKKEVLDQIERLAASKKTSFSFYDAAVLTQKIKSIY